MNKNSAGITLDNCRDKAEDYDHELVRIVDSCAKKMYGEIQRKFPPGNSHMNGQDMREGQKLSSTGVNNSVNI